jgi:hypothetical protein
MRDTHEIHSFTVQGKTFEYAGKKIDQPKDKINFTEGPNPGDFTAEGWFHIPIQRKSSFEGNAWVHTPTDQGVNISKLPMGGNDPDIYFTPDDDEDFVTTQGSVGGITISGGSSGQGGTFGNINYGTIVPSGGAAGNLNWPNTNLTFTSGGAGGTYTAGQGVSFANTTPKSDVQYIIVTGDGDCLEMVEQSTVSPREMIGICKFINIVTQAQVDNLCIVWSDMITNLGIDRHFKNAGLTETDYDDDTPILNVFLYDAV